MAQPVVAMTISVLTKTEPAPNLRKILGWAKLFAIAMTVTGSVLVVLESSPKESEVHVNGTCTASEAKESSSSGIALGYILLGWNLTAFCLFIVLQKRLLYQNPKYLRWKQRPVTFVAWCTLLGYPLQLVTLPVARFMASDKCGVHIGMFTMAGKAILVVEYQIFLNASLCVLLIAWAAIRLAPSVITVFIPTQVSVFACLCCARGRLEL